MKTALVTGGGGFLGGAIVGRLLESGVGVRSFSRGSYPALAIAGVDVRRGDLADYPAVWEACDGCDTVFHVAAKAGIWGRGDDFYRANVTGTRNVLEACRARGVARLVYTSSPSVVFRGRNMEGVDESVPYALHYEAAYPRTKALAERMVLRANGRALSTVSLRPHNIWGPGDPHIVPRIVGRARAGQLFQVGRGRNVVDTVYVDNAAEAHLQAAARLAPGSTVAGRSYFLSQGDPRPLWDFINGILAAASLPPVDKRIPASLAYCLGAVFELAHSAFLPLSEPRMTRFLAKELATSHWFDIGAAKRDFGYNPRVSTEEGLERLADWLRQGPSRQSGIL